MKTEQESFWAGEFGRDYIGRNQNTQLITSNISIFTRILAKTRGVNAIAEFGCNIGMNLRAINNINPNIQLTGVEINADAVSELKTWGGAKVVHDSIIDYQHENQFDLTFTKGVLIHINPDYLTQVYQNLYASSKKYILVVEYYSPKPVTIDYRGHENRLFKRDFAGEMLEAYPDLELVDYGFFYHRDPVFPSDDLNWFLMRKI
ncbi:MAG: pseudaminic acid biosynthesis-associated methylase [Gammaproteobacteria bacterium]|nr:pseudaminic acid biosynthesis-associated methylase [Gammaproteobacteria bacterium]